MWCLSRSAGGRRYTAACEGIWEQKESRIEDGQLMADHVHMMIAIPPKYAMSQVVGFINNRENSRLGRGDSQSLTVPGVCLGFACRRFCCCGCFCFQTVAKRLL
jgi:REP element-mobilizing transposase RayT